MARKKAESAEPIGPIITENLYRLGFGFKAIRHADIARLVSEKTDKNWSRQRIAAILNSVRVEPETIATIAKAIGVKPAELTKPVPKKKGGLNP